MCGIDEANRAVDVEIEEGARVVREDHIAGEPGGGAGCFCYSEGFCIDGCGGEPVFEVELGIGAEEDGVLAAFGAEPEAVFTAEHIDMGFRLSGGDEVAVDPAVAAAFGAGGGAGHDAALVVSDEGDLGLFGRVAEDDYVGVFFEEVDIFLERGA